MSIWTFQQIAGFWEGAGGAPVHAIDAVAVAKAESGGNDRAISPSHDYGLWQINTVNFAHLGITSSTALDPHVSARAAVIMSGNGTNWAAWCTAWLHPDGNCGHGYLPHPQAGSPAGYWVPYVGAAFGSLPPQGPQAPPQADMASISAAWADVVHFVGSSARKRYGTINDIRTATRRLAQ